VDWSLFKDNQRHCEKIKEKIEKEMKKEREECFELRVCHLPQNNVCDPKWTINRLPFYNTKINILS